MTEQLNRTGLKEKVIEMTARLEEVANNPSVCALCLYAFPPWLSKGDKDLDLLIVVEEDSGSDLKSELNHELAVIARDNLEIDAWVLTAEELKERMRRIAGLEPAKPNIYESVSAWDGFGFVPLSGKELLSKIIDESYDNPEKGGAIPADENQWNPYSSF